MSGLRIVVVGGSLGGLMAATALTRAGHDVIVLERSATPLQDQGAGIRIQPSVERFFETTLERDFALAATTLDSRCYLDADGDVVSRVAEPGACTHWGRFYEALAQIDHGEYRLGQLVVGFEQDATEARALLADGTTVAGDVLAFADGVGSTGRAQIYPELTPSYAGYVGWRGAVRADSQSPDLVSISDAALVIHIAGRSHIHVYPVPGESGGSGTAERLMNFVWYRNVPEGPELDALFTDVSGRRRAFSVPHHALTTAALSEAFAAAERTLPASLARLVTSSDAFVQSVVDLTVPAMAHGRVAFIGDAAFVARPHAGAGTAKAAENVAALVAELSSADDVVESLARWQVDQLSRGRDLVRRSAVIGDLYQRTGTYPGDPLIEAALRDLGRLPASDDQSATLEGEQRDYRAQPE